MNRRNGLTFTAFTSLRKLPKEAHGNVSGWGSMLQAGKPRVRIPMMSLDFLIDLIIPEAFMALGSTQSLKEMSTRNIPGG
jgi:hypothetical protein